MLKALARKGLEVADNICAAISPRLDPRAGSLITVLFHSLHRDRGELANPALAPGQNTTADDFRRFVGAILDNGFTPVSPDQVDAGLKPGANYVMITFDDGYFNNTLALDVLEEFRAPATFFISSDHVLEEKGFWWDAFNRELVAAGASPGTRKAEISRVKAWTSEKIEAYLHGRFGPGVLKPRGDLDRPFTPSELQDFARNKWVHLGNHTRDHAILTNCSREEISRQIQGCQEALASLVGYAPIIIAYPNGDYSREAVEAARQAGLRVGLTVRPRRNALPLDDEKSRMTLGRFMPSGGPDIAKECRKFTRQFVPSNMVKSLLMSGY